MIKTHKMISLNNDMLMIMVLFSVLLHDKLIYANCLIVYLVQRETA